MNIINKKGKIDFSLLKEAINALYIGKGIIVLEPMSVTNWYLLCGFLKKIENVCCFSLNYHNEKKVVLRYFVPGMKNDFKKLHELAIYNYEQCNFETAKILFKRLLSYGGPDFKSYAKLGMCYLQLKDYYKALECLMVADDLAFKETNNHMYADYVERVRKLVEVKEPRNIKLLALAIDATNHYGINNLIDIVNLVSGTDMDLSSACLIFGLDYTETLIVKLILAQQCYCNRMEDCGDALTIQVEKSATNNKKVLALMDKTFEFKENLSEKIPARVRINLNNHNIVE
ncbi:MAG: hypothetical protein IJA94_04320 [Bacilli bacterium]|nr:hypothetical protein [Bacilli bacterium]